MKTLLLLRHGKSDWDAPFSHDHDRPLASRGVRGAKTMGRFITSSGEEPDAIITSSAVRARETVRIASEAGGWSAVIRESSQLYGASPHSVLGLVQEEHDGTSRLLLAGHEPTWSATLSRLIGGGSIRFPTAAAARIDFEVASWQHVQFGLGELIWLVAPKALKKLDF